MTKAIEVLAAGSLRHALPAIIQSFTEASGADISLSLGPAGLLRERIEAGAHFDLFASANMAHPHRLAAAGMTEEAICFARNRLCIIARADLGLTSENFLNLLSSPGIRIGTSTPGDDPSGDYAFEVFERVEAKHPGFGAAMRSRARQLVGGRNSAPVPPGKATGYLISDGAVDLMMSYYSNARLLDSDPAFQVVEIPSEFSPTIEYGLALRNFPSAITQQLKNFILSKAGQTILQAAGFTPVV